MGCGVMGGMSSADLEHPIVFFDGQCVMCNGFLDWMMAIDRSAMLRVSPLQGETAKRLLPPLPHKAEEWSIYFLDETGLYSQSEAVIQILRRLGGVWALLSVGGVVPVALRDAVYRTVATNRYRILGKRETCRVPSEKEQSRFLP
jgi:predicted DCC family thiol-disulfide oxidoreductase YuxK